ncbi:unnamed protein product [Caenorhabditis brenneri]
MSDIKLTKEEERVIWEWLLTNIGDEEMVHELDQKELIFKCCSSHRSFGILPSELFQIFHTQMKENIIYLPLGRNEMLKLIEAFRIQLSGEAVEYLESKYPIIIFRTPTGRIARVDSYEPVNINRNQSGNYSTTTTAITTHSYQPMEDSEKIEIIEYILEQLRIKRSYANLK